MDSLPAFSDIAGHISQYYQSILLVIPLMLLLTYATYTDVTELKITNKLNLTIVIVRLVLIPFCGISFYNLLGFAFCFGLFLFVACLTYTNMGGDIKCAGAMGFYLGLHVSVLVIFLACGSAIAYGIIRKFAKRGRNFPFAPFFLIGYMLTTLGYGIFQYIM